LNQARQIAGAWRVFLNRNAVPLSRRCHNLVYGGRWSRNDDDAELGPSPHYRLWVVMTSVQDASSGTAREELALGNAETGKARRFSTTTVIHARDGDGAFWDLSLSVECVNAARSGPLVSCCRPGIVV
jgi:hypothetical protein